MALTLKQLADMCGKDSSTVSRALRDDPRVKPATRDFIKQKALELGYKPNVMARNLSVGKTQTVWLISPGLNTLEHEVALRSSLFMNANNYDLAITLFHGDEDVHKRLIERLAHGGADGAIVMPLSATSHADFYQQLADRNVPIVFMDRSVEDVDVITVTTDNYLAGRTLVDLCYEQGAQEFIVLFKEKNPAEAARRKGAIDRLKELNCPAVFDAESTVNPASNHIAILSSMQEHIQNCLVQQTDNLKNKTFVFGTFDSWQGEPYPAEKAFVCIQDFKTMTEYAGKTILDMINNSAANSKQKITIPPLEFKTIERVY